MNIGDTFATRTGRKITVISRAKWYPENGYLFDDGLTRHADGRFFKDRDSELDAVPLSASQKPVNLFSAFLR